MDNIFQPVIVVAAYNRPKSLLRILGSLNNAVYPKKIELIISIDNDQPHNLNVKKVADDFTWNHGSKTVLYQEEHLGLRKHIIKCGDLVNEYGSVIILEDDLFVSPFFYDYALQALDFYGDDERINGISLYNLPIQEISQYPFEPIYDGSDVYFLQFPSSLGQVWTRKHWTDFREWYNSGPDLTLINIPSKVKAWPETSWKKYFCAYLVEKDKFFVFPNFSFTTNFNDPGTNRRKLVNHDGQTPLRLTGKPYRFTQLGDSLSIYDVNQELLADCITKFGSHLEEYSFELDLYGTKELEKVKTPFIITSKASSKPLMGFRRALKPHEMNVIMNLEGMDFTLSRVEDILTSKNQYERRISNYKYFYTRNNIGWKAQVYSYYSRFRNRKPKRG